MFNIFFTNPFTTVSGGGYCDLIFLFKNGLVVISSLAIFLCFEISVWCVGDSTIGFQKCMFSCFFISETCCLRSSTYEWSCLFSFSINSVLCSKFLTCDIQYWEVMHHVNMNGAIYLSWLLLQLLRVKSCVSVVNLSLRSDDGGETSIEVFDIFKNYLHCCCHFFEATPYHCHCRAVWGVWGC